MNLSLEVTELDGTAVDFALLMPPLIAWLQKAIKLYRNVTILPIMANLGVKQCALVDSHDYFRRGTNTLAIWSATDHSKALLLSDSLLGYLERYVQRVESDFYSTLKGRIEGFPRDPTSFNGSRTVTHGVCIEAVAKYIHFCSRFGPDPLYYFAY